MDGQVCNEDFILAKHHIVATEKKTTSQISSQTRLNGLKSSRVERTNSSQ